MCTMFASLIICIFRENMAHQWTLSTFTLNKLSRFRKKKKSSIDLGIRFSLLKYTVIKLSTELWINGKILAYIPPPPLLFAVLKHFSIDFLKIHFFLLYDYYFSTSVAPLELFSLYYSIFSWIFQRDFSVHNFLRDWLNFEAQGQGKITFFCTRTHQLSKQGFQNPLWNKSLYSIYQLT